METADITVATATDVAGNLENVPSSSSPSFEIDTDVPTILSAVTDDTMGAAGQIDEVQVTFSEALDIASLALSDFDAGAYTVSGLNATMGNPTVTLTLDELGSSDTDATPTISIIGDGVNDEAGNNLGTGDAGDNIVSTDGADPAITGITSTAGDGPHNEPDVIDVNVQFSESVTIA